MRRFLLLVICCILIVSIPLSVCASQPKIVDKADLLTPQEELELENRANELVDTYHMDVVIVTVWSLEGKTPTQYADDYFDYNGYGIGDNFSGVLFLLAMENREWAISTCGDTIYALTDYGIQLVFDEAAWYLSEDLYYYGFDAYLTALEPFFQAYANGAPLDGFTDDYQEPEDWDDVVFYPDYVVETEPAYSFSSFLVALLIGAAVGGIALLIMRSGMNTAKAQSGAQSYLKQGTYHLYRQQDIFLYSHVSKIRRSESSSSSGGSHRGGGSSVHLGSSGRSHGGRSGRF